MFNYKNDYMNKGKKLPKKIKKKYINEDTITYNKTKY